MIWYDMIWDWTGKNKKQQKTKANEWKAPDVIESWKQIKKKKTNVSFMKKLLWEWMDDDIYLQINFNLSNFCFFDFVHTMSFSIV